MLDIELLKRLCESILIHFDFSCVIWIILVDDVLVVLIQKFRILGDADCLSTQIKFWRVEENSVLELYQLEGRHILDLRDYDVLAVICADLAVWVRRLILPRQTRESPGVVSPLVHDGLQLLILLGKELHGLEDLQRCSQSIGAGDSWNDLASHFLDFKQGLHGNAEVVGPDVGCSGHEFYGVSVVFVECHGPNVCARRVNGGDDTDELLYLFGQWVHCCLVLLV